jgi:hypothetical protein
VCRGGTYRIVGLRQRYSRRSRNQDTTKRAVVPPQSSCLGPATKRGSPFSLRPRYGVCEGGRSPAEERLRGLVRRAQEQTVSGTSIVCRFRLTEFRWDGRFPHDAARARSRRTNGEGMDKGLRKQTRSGSTRCHDTILSARTQTPTLYPSTIQFAKPQSPTSSGSMCHARLPTPVKMDSNTYHLVVPADGQHDTKVWTYRRDTETQNKWFHHYHHYLPVKRKQKKKAKRTVRTKLKRTKWNQ